jgi:hypothetical protein
MVLTLRHGVATTTEIDRMHQIRTHLYETTVSTTLIRSIDGAHEWFETMVFGPYGDEAVAFSLTAEDACIAHDSICKAISCATGAEYESAQLRAFMNIGITRKVQPDSRGMSLAIRKIILNV